MKKKLFENLFGLLNNNDTEKIANINTADDSINTDTFDDDSYIEDVLNNEESIKLGLTAQFCKIQYE